MGSTTRHFPTLSRYSSTLRSASFPSLPPMTTVPPMAVVEHAAYARGVLSDANGLPTQVPSRVRLTRSHVLPRRSKECRSHALVLRCTKRARRDLCRPTPTRARILERCPPPRLFRRFSSATRSPPLASTSSPYPSPSSIDSSFPTRDDPAIVSSTASSTHAATFASSPRAGSKPLNSTSTSSPPKL